MASEIHARMLVDVSGRSVLPLEPSAAYADVPRLQICADGAVEPWERPPAEP